MARPKGTTKKKTVIDDRFQVKDVSTPLCINCGVNGKVSQFYRSNNQTHIFNSCYIPYCKTCIENFYQEYYKKTGRSDLAIYLLCRKTDTFYSSKVFEGAESTSLKLNQSLVSCYFRMLNSIKDNAGFKDNFNDSANFLDIEILEDKYRSGKMGIGDNDNEIIAPDAFTARATVRICSSLSTEQGPAIMAKLPPPIFTRFSPLPATTTVSSGWKLRFALLNGSVMRVTRSIISSPASRSMSILRVSPMRPSTVCISPSETCTLTFCDSSQCIRLSR